MLLIHYFLHFILFCNISCLLLRGVQQTADDTPRRSHAAGGIKAAPLHMIAFISELDSPCTSSASSTSSLPPPQIPQVTSPPATSIMNPVTASESGVSSVSVTSAASSDTPQASAPVFKGKASLTAGYVYVMGCVVSMP